MWLVEKMPLQSFRCSLLQSCLCQILLISSRILLGFFFLCLKAKALSKIFLWIGDVFACTWWGSVVHMILKPAPSGGCSTMNGFRWEGWIPATCRVSHIPLCCLVPPPGAAGISPFKPHIPWGLMTPWGWRSSPTSAGKGVRSPTVSRLPYGRRGPPWRRWDTFFRTAFKDSAACWASTLASLICSVLFLTSSLPG